MQNEIASEYTLDKKQWQKHVLHFAGGSNIGENSSFTNNLNSYGNTIETYDDIMMLNGQELSVSFFRLGRIGYYYKTLDGDQSGYWNKKNSEWVDMGSKLSNEIESAIDIANRQAPPNFIKLPVSPLENK